MTPRKDVSNRFLSVEIIIPFLLLGIGGVASFASLSADVEHKSDKTDVAVMKEKVDRIAVDVSDNKSEIKQLGKVARKNHEILIRIQTALEITNGEVHDHD